MSDNETNWLSDLSAIDALSGGVSKRAADSARVTRATRDETVAARDTRHHVLQDEYNERIMARALNVESFAQAAQRAGEQLGGDVGGALVDDVLAALYSASPLTQDVDAPYRHSADVLDATLKSEQWQELHASTVHDELSSALSASALIDAATQRIVALRNEAQREQQQQEQQQREQQQQEQQQREQQQQEQQNDASAGAQSAQSAQSGQNAQDGQSDAPSADDASAGAQSGAAGDTQSSAQSSAQSSSATSETQRGTTSETREQRERDAETRNVMRAALDAAQAAADEQATAEALLMDAGWSSEAGSAGSAGDINARAKLARELATNKRLQDVLKLAGRLRFVANAAQRKRVRHVPDREFGVTRGRDLADVLPSELARLGHPKLRKLFFASYAASELLQADHRGKQEQGRGPVIACLDNSGSMTFPVLPPLKKRARASNASNAANAAALAHEYSRSDWATAVALCLLMIARKQKRDFRLVHFGGVGELVVQDFPKGMGDAESLLFAATFFLGGGTDFETPLSAALEAVETSTYKKADVIFITDGLASLSPAFLTRWADARRAKQMRCHGLLIGDTRDYVGADDAGYGLRVLRSFCDDAERLTMPGGDEDSDALSASFSI